MFTGHHLPSLLLFGCFELLVGRTLERFVSLTSTSTKQNKNTQFVKSLNDKNKHGHVFFTMKTNNIFSCQSAIKYIFRFCLFWDKCVKVNF